MKYDNVTHFSQRIWQYLILELHFEEVPWIDMGHHFEPVHSDGGETEGGDVDRSTL